MFFLSSNQVQQNTKFSSSLSNIDEIVLHFDVNGTIIAEDKAGGETPPEFIEKLLQRAKKEGREVSEQVLAAVAQKLAMRDADADVFIFPGFFRLLDILDAEEVPYKVMIRTFGSDIPDIITEITKTRSNIDFAHVDFKTQNLDASTQRQVFAAGPNKQWSCVQENYEHWDINGRTAQTGKQLCLNKNAGTFDVFFDDCVRRKDIIHVIDANGATMDKQEAIARGHLVDVDTLSAICDDDYFIKQLMKASARYADSLRFAPLQLLNLA